MSFALRLTEDRLGAGAQLTLPPAPRVLYARNGAGTIETRPPTVRTQLADPATTTRTELADPATTVRTELADPATTNPATTKSAWHGSDVVSVSAEAPATLLRFELIRGSEASVSSSGKVDSRVLLEHAIDLDPARQWLMRCDRVDFAPGGVALPHGHRGGGIRCLLVGALEVTVGGRPPRLMRPGDAWFESGREPVLAKAAPDIPTAFVRVAILPREIRGQSSIVYVDPADAARGRPRQYTVYVDEPFALG